MLVIRIRILLVLAVVVFLMGLGRAISNLRVVLSGSGKKSPRKKAVDPPYNPRDVVEAQWEDVQKPGVGETQRMDADEKD